MRIPFKKLLITSIIFSLSTIAFATDIPISLLAHSKNTTSVPINKVTTLVQKNISLTNASEYSKANVEVIFDRNNKPDYLLVYLLSAKTYHFSITKIKINENYEVISVTPNYVLQKNDYEQQKLLHATGPKCPDKSVEFVAATPVPSYPTAKDAVDTVYQQAKSSGYVAIELLGDDASVGNYENWLVCPKLKGFFNVGHGNSLEILLADGLLTHDNISTLIKNKLGEHALLLFNSCEVDNDPLKSSITEDADAQKYAGGITTLYIGPSEAASKCFWDAAFHKQALSVSLENCNNSLDPQDQFGISGHGADILNAPSMKTY